MTDEITITYQTLTGIMRKKEYSPIPGSTHWTLTTYEKRDGEWQAEGSAEVKYVETEEYDE